MLHELNAAIMTNPFEIIENRLSNIELLLTNLNQQPAPQPEPDRWMTVEELREYLPEHPQVQTIYTGCAVKRIPFNKQGKRLYFLKSEIDAWLKSGRRKTFAEIQADAKQPKR